MRAGTAQRSLVNTSPPVSLVAARWQIKLLVGFLQVLVSFRDSLSVGWPPQMEKFFRTFAFINL